MVSHDRLNFPNSKETAAATAAATTTTTMFQRFAASIGGGMLKKKRRNKKDDKSNKRGMTQQTQQQQRHYHHQQYQQQQQQQHQHQSTLSSNLPCCKLHNLKPKHHPTNELAIVACGNFWTPQYRFSQMYGVVETITGYIGGTSDEPELLQQRRIPTYHNIYDYTEAICIEYNPNVIRYKDILQMWRDNDDPFTQQLEDPLRYRSAIFVLNEYQYKVAKRFMNKIQNERPYCYLYTDIEWVYTREEEKEKTTTTTTSLTAPETTTVVAVEGTTTTTTNTTNHQHQKQRDLVLQLPFYIAEEMHQDYVIKEWKIAKEHLIAWTKQQTKSGLFPISE